MNRKELEKYSDIASTHKVQDKRLLAACMAIQNYIARIDDLQIKLECFLDPPSLLSAADFTPSIDKISFEGVKFKLSILKAEIIVEDYRRLHETNGGD